MEIKEFDRVRLKDGREGDVMEVLGDQEAFIITLGEYMKWYDETILYEDIEKVLLKDEV